MDVKDPHRVALQIVGRCHDQPCVAAKGDQQHTSDAEKDRQRSGEPQKPGGVC